MSAWRVRHGKKKWKMQIRTLNGYVEAEPTGKMLKTPFGVCEYYKLSNGKVILYGIKSTANSEKGHLHNR